MGEFSADWLALREPADRLARSLTLTREMAERLSHSESIRVLDLATGTGSNVRYLAPHFQSPQQWRLIDRDAGLLKRLPQSIASWALDRGYITTGDPGGFSLRGAAMECRIEVRSADLSKLADAALFQDRTLVTASALLDLVSEQWLQTLAGRCRDVRAAVLFALTYDGRIECMPAEPEDALVRELVNRHQRTGKGFGRALGPEATDGAVRCFEAAGYETRCATSDWQLTPSQDALQQQLIEGWAEAAAAIDPGQADAVNQWKQRRLDHVSAGTSRLMVGHVDLSGWPR